MKPLFSRGSHVFEAPVLLSQTPLDARALAAATLLPPLISAGMHYLVLRPLRKRLRVQQVRLPARPAVAGYQSPCVSMFPQLFLHQEPAVPW